MNAQGLSIWSDSGIILNEGSFSIYEGEILAFCQTSQMPSFFISLMSASDLIYSGKILYKGKPLSVSNPLDCSYVAGRDSLFDTLSIVDNLYAFTGSRNGFIYSVREAERKVTEMLDAIGVPFAMPQSIDDLSISQKYILELVRAIIRGSRLIVLDNIAQNCSRDNYTWIIETLERYSKEGISFVLLSNEDNQLISKCDRVYFCRGTSIVDVIFKDEYSHGLFQKIMYNNSEPIRKRRCGNLREDRPALEISLSGELNADQCITVYRGEVYGIFDLFGTLAETVFNSFFESFPYKVGGKVCQSYEEAVKNGLLIISQNRSEMLFDTFSFEENFVFQALRKFSRIGIINRRMVRYAIDKYMPRQKEEGDSREEGLQCLKFLFYRCLLTNPAVIVIENPALDLEADQQAEIEKMLYEATCRGCAVVLIGCNASVGIPFCNRALILRKRGLIEKIVCDRENADGTSENRDYGIGDEVF